MVESSGATMIAMPLLRLLSVCVSAGVVRCVLCASLLFLTAEYSHAGQTSSDYPLKPIRIIVAASPGAADDFFARALGIDAMHVPFRMVSDTFVEMGLGRVHYAVYILPAVLGPVREGRLRALAVMTPQRSSTLPDVPAIAEVGLPEAQFDSWSGIVAPKGTPRRIVEQLHGDIVRGLRKVALRERFMRQGAESTPESTPDGFMRHMQEEYLRYQALIRESKVGTDY